MRAIKHKLGHIFTTIYDYVIAEVSRKKCLTRLQYFHRSRILDIKFFKLSLNKTIE